MSAQYKELVINESKKSRDHGNHGIPFSYSGKLQRFLNPIKQSQYYVVGGRSSAGKRSFTDLHFVIGAYIWWANQPEEERPPLKIFYYNMDKSAKQKLQKLLCTYLWLSSGTLMDINTLNGMSSRMYDVKGTIKNEIEGSSTFFDEFFNVVEMFHGPNNPQGIFNEVTRYMKTIGEDVTEGYENNFKYNAGYEDQITLVIVDNVKKIKAESRKGVYYPEPELHGKLNEHFVELRDKYKVSSVAVVPSWDVPGSFKLNQMTPDFRELKYYHDDANIVLHLFNPFRFQINEYNGWNSEDFVSQGDNVPRFRVCSILRNTDGGDSAQIPLFFIPENGVFTDLCSLSEPDLINKWTDYAKTFKTEQLNFINGKT